MGTAEHYDIRTCIEQRLQARPDDPFSFGSGHASVLDKLHKTFPDMLDNPDRTGIRIAGPDIFLAAQGAGSSEDPDNSGPGKRGSRLYGRLHADEIHMAAPAAGNLHDMPCRTGIRSRVFCTQDIYGCGSGRIASHYNDIRTLGKQEIGYGPCPADNEITGLLSVRATGIVGKIYIVLSGEKPVYLPEHRQASGPRIEYAYCRHGLQI